MEYPQYPEGSKSEKTFNVDEIRNTLFRLAISQLSYVVIGGANLVLRDIKHETTDIDLLVSHPTLKRLKKYDGARVSGPPEHARLRGADNESVHIENKIDVPTTAFTYLSGNGYYPMSFPAVRESAEMLNNIPLASLDEVIASKQALARPKDINDLQRIAYVTKSGIAIPHEKHDSLDEYSS